MRFLLLFALILILPLHAAETPAATPPHVDPVILWMDVCQHALNVDDKAENAARPESSRVPAELALALFEASNGVEQRYQSALKLAPAAAATSADAAVSAAAHTLLTIIFPDQAKSFDDALKISLGNVPEGPAKAAGIAYGQLTAKAVRAHAALPENASLPHYRPLTEPGVYIDPRLPSIEPFHVAQPMLLMARLDEVRPGPPPALSSTRYAQDLEEVRLLGGEKSSTRTEMQGLFAKPWLQIDYHPMMVRVARQPGRSLSQNARLFALANVAIEDAWSAIMEAKMHYATWRPITAIRNADRDGNPGTVHDPAWLPLLKTPSHSDYPCGHCGVAAAFATAMESETGPEPVGGVYLSSFVENPAFQMVLPSWKAFVDEMSMSRIYAGAHTRSANDAGEQIGHAAAKIVLQQMQPTN